MENLNAKCTLCNFISSQPTVKLTKELKRQQLKQKQTNIIIFRLLFPPLFLDCAAVISGGQCSGGGRSLIFVCAGGTGGEGDRGSAGTAGTAVGGAAATAIGGVETLCR